MIKRRTSRSDSVWMTGFECWKPRHKTFQWLVPAWLVLRAGGAARAGWMCAADTVDVVTSWHTNRLRSSNCNSLLTWAGGDVAAKPAVVTPTLPHLQEQQEIVNNNDGYGNEKLQGEEVLLKEPRGSGQCSRRIGY